MAGIVSVYFIHKLQKEFTNNSLKLVKTLKIVAAEIDFG